MKHIYIILFCISFACTAIAQSVNTKVALIGENEKEYEKIMTECSSSLLSISENSMDKAFNLWTTMLSDFEETAENQGFDIKGTKVWMNLFWEADGSIKKIVYYPKPNSKNIDFNQFTKLLETFATNYYLEIDHDTCFSHYGSASFPILTKVSVPNEK